MSEGEGRKTASGVLWSAIERFSVQAIQLILSVIIARLVQPSDYGLIAMLSIFMAIAQTFIDCGFSNALIHKQQRTNIDYSTAFYFNVLIGVVVYAILYVSSPFIASFYSEPRLELLTKVISLNLIINSLSIVQITKLTVDMNFKLQAIISLAAVVVSGGVGVYLAYTGYGVWTLVVQTLLNNMLNVVLLWCCVRWFPLLSFSLKSFKELFNFGSKLLLSGLLETIYTNLYTLVIGKKFSADQVGFYNRAFVFSQLPSYNITFIINRVIYPLLCAQQEKPEILKQHYIHYLRLTCLLIFSLMIGLCCLADPIINIVLTDRWSPAAVLLQLLCIAYMWYPVINFNYLVLNAVGRTDYVLKSEVLKKINSVAVLLLTFPVGIKGMCSGIAVSLLFNVFFGMFFTSKVISLSMREQWKELLPVLTISVSMGIFIYGVGLLIDNAYAKVAIEIPIAVLFVLAGLFIFKFRESIILVNYSKKIICYVKSRR